MSIFAIFSTIYASTEILSPRFSFPSPEFVTQKRDVLLANDIAEKILSPAIKKNLLSENNIQRLKGYITGSLLGNCRYGDSKEGYNHIREFLLVSYATPKSRRSWLDANVHQNTLVFMMDESKKSLDEVSKYWYVMGRVIEDLAKLLGD